MRQQFISMTLYAEGVYLINENYRANCVKVAKELGVTGYVGEVVNGRMRLVAESDPAVTTEFLRKIRQIPNAGRFKDNIDSLDIEDVRIVRERRYKQFQTRHNN